MTDARRLIAESIGTFFLVLIGPGAVMVNAASSGAISHVGIALAFAFVVIAMILALAHCYEVLRGVDAHISESMISGSHLAMGVEGPIVNTTI